MYGYENFFLASRYPRDPIGSGTFAQQVCIMSKSLTRTVPFFAFLLGDDGKRRGEERGHKFIQRTKEGGKAFHENFEVLSGPPPPKKKRSRQRKKKNGTLPLYLFTVYTAFYSTVYSSFSPFGYARKRHF